MLIALLLSSYCVVAADVSTNDGVSRAAPAGYTEKDIEQVKTQILDFIEKEGKTTINHKYMPSVFVHGPFNDIEFKLTARSKYEAGKLKAARFNNAYEKAQFIKQAQNGNLFLEYDPDWAYGGQVGPDNNRVCNPELFGRIIGTAEKNNLDDFEITYSRYSGPTNSLSWKKMKEDYESSLDSDEENAKRKLDEYRHDIATEYRDHAATKIQKTWKGFKAKKDFSERKQASDTRVAAMFEGNE